VVFSFGKLQDRIPTLALLPAFFLIAALVSASAVINQG
jgi:hypothetical protein